MTPEQITLFSLMGVVFALLLWGRFRYDLVAFGALIVAVLLGLVPASRAFEGFVDAVDGRPNGRAPISGSWAGSAGFCRAS